ncbi:MULTISPECIES: hypothetical protein [unclassified Lebetimonas]|uniref:hypothetical protein n=1 Tax=unclassified Lebetimonas TaxID=2648158 RepID=UPI0004641093|nr:MULTISPECIES: hypothetical protein [unclassified Lebetimonas]
MKKEKEEFNNLLQKIGLNRKEFAELSKVPYNTVKMWGIDRKVPSWVKPFIENYIKAKKFETAKKALCENNFSDTTND